MKKDSGSEIEVDKERECDAWIGAEILRLKQAGFDDQFIATHIQACACGDPEALASLSKSNAIDGIAFPSDFAFGTTEVRERFRLALADVIPPELAEWRKLTNERCEQLWLSAQSGIAKGDPASISAGLRIVIFQGQMLGFEGSEPLPEDTGTDDSTVTREMLDRLTDEELDTFDYLSRKLYGKLDDEDNAAESAQMGLKENGTTGKKTNSSK